MAGISDESWQHLATLLGRNANDAQLQVIRKKLEIHKQLYLVSMVVPDGISRHKLRDMWIKTENERWKRIADAARILVGELSKLGAADELRRDASGMEQELARPSLVESLAALAEIADEQKIGRAAPNADWTRDSLLDGLFSIYEEVTGKPAHVSVGGQESKRHGKSFGKIVDFVQLFMSTIPNAGIPTADSIKGFESKRRGRKVSNRVKK